MPVAPESALRGSESGALGRGEFTGEMDVWKYRVEQLIAMRSLAGSDRSQHNQE